MTILKACNIQSQLHHCPAWNHCTTLPLWIPPTAPCYGCWEHLATPATVVVAGAGWRRPSKRKREKHCFIAASHRHAACPRAQKLFQALGEIRDTDSYIPHPAAQPIFHNPVCRAGIEACLSSPDLLTGPLVASHSHAHRRCHGKFLVLRCDCSKLQVSTKVITFVQLIALSVTRPLVI